MAPSLRESREGGAKFFLLRTVQLVSPSGRDVAQRQRGLEPANLAFQICPDTNLFACCSFRRGWRRATFLREEGFGFPHSPNLSLPLGEMSRSDREGWKQLVWLFKFALTQTCLRAALSVICFANASSPEGRAEKLVRNFSSYAQSHPFPMMSSTNCIAHSMQNTHSTILVIL